MERVCLASVGVAATIGLPLLSTDRLVVHWLSYIGTAIYILITIIIIEIIIIEIIEIRIIIIIRWEVDWWIIVNKTVTRYI